MIRYADKSAPAGAGLGRPVTSTVTRTPAPQVRATSLSRPARPGAGASGAAAGHAGPAPGAAPVPAWALAARAAGPASCWRSTPSIRRISSRASLLVAWIAPSASLAPSGLTSMTYWPYPACTAITDMLCATTSCSSRAIRSRSSATALFAACCCSVTTYSRRCRAEYPVIQAMTLASATGMRSPGPTCDRGATKPPADDEERHDGKQQAERGEPGPPAALDRHRVKHERGGKKGHRRQRGSHRRQQHAEDHEAAERGDRCPAAQRHRREERHHEQQDEREPGPAEGVRGHGRAGNRREAAHRAVERDPVAEPHPLRQRRPRRPRRPATRVRRVRRRPAVADRIRHVAFRPHEPTVSALGAKRLIPGE